MQRSKILPAVLPPALVLGAFFILSPCVASDWVEDGVSEFRLPARQPPAQPPGAQDAPADYNVPAQAPPPVYRTPQKGERTWAGSGTTRDPGSDDDQAESEDVKTSGAIQGDGKNTPLQATISTFRQDYRRRTQLPGLDGFAANRLQQAPFFPPPDKAENISPTTFKSWLEKTHPGLKGNISKEDIIEVKGKWDDSGHVMRSFGLPFTQVSARSFSETNLDQAKVIVINCAGDIPSEAILSIRRFVGMGGFLITTDWALAGVLQKAFPGFVEWNGGYTEGRVVDAVVVDPDPELFKNVPQAAYWKLDKKSQTVKVVRPGPVRVLARSRLLMRMDPSELGILAFTLDYGRGRILHLVGHFDNNSDLAFNNALPDPAPGIGISFRQALAANFLVRAIKEHGNPVAAADQ
ncbi:MAG: hypothetical protein KC777_20925 [Cyanobacteria bacterium HKST-UBA02]|nr:hypothetical protein [Cyanobacteria bacterium HKST-UBA02]